MKHKKIIQNLLGRSGCEGQARGTGSAGKENLGDLRKPGLLCIDLRHLLLPRTFHFLFFYFGLRRKGWEPSPEGRSPEI